MRKRILWIIVVLLWYSIPVFSAEFVPVFDLHLLGGQSWFQNEMSSAGVNFNLNFTPALKFSESLSFLPVYSGWYLGNKQMAQLEGGGFLYQETQDHILNLELLHKPIPEIKSRLSMGYKKEWAKETKDEFWGTGLYDYDKVSIGIQQERQFTRWKFQPVIKGGVDVYAVFYPNYNSLASEVGKEVAGRKMLDHLTGEIFFNEAILLTDSLILRGDYAFSYGNFFEQYVITESADYPANKRQDYINELGLDLTYFIPLPFENLESTLGLNYRAKLNQSSQNHYDVERYIFIPHFYDYLQHKIGPQITFTLIPSNLSISISYDYAHKQFFERLAQNSTGDYLAEKMDWSLHNYGLRISYPILKSLSVEISGGLQQSISNNRFERIYRYNYVSANYLAGIAWEY
ncbi:hypothetical protein COS91_06670 [Candidatus Desantisbacteria bacterium CG07_land_8_20_14_0_80_39_15]|uniref:Uncharacterized protein n=1 Tax=Candidatus Desantisbacteria bacterium CG07_land_8_20_14_0_80_39_15 TaxID=1974549 RepID=A0A2M6ZF92_9BACT|nr:MAG: hypothetical protein COS91_06670 [Candidatus Desantisbacteria bacterium CG07_land_8_20_14_0_80_39_15]